MSKRPFQSSDIQTFAISRQKTNIHDWSPRFTPCALWRGTLQIALRKGFFAEGPPCSGLPRWL